MKGEHRSGASTVVATLLAVMVIGGCDRRLATPTPYHDDEAVAGLLKERSAAVTAEPRAARPRVELAMAFEANGMWSEARATYAEAALLAPPDVGSRFHAALMAAQAGESEAARTAFRELAVAHPEFAPALQQLGYAELESGNFQAAAHAFSRLMEVAPTAAFGAIGAAQVAIAESQFERAIALLEPVVRLEPDERSAHHLLGTAYRAVGRLAEAERELRAGLNGERLMMPDAMAFEIQRLAVGLASRMAAARAHAAGGDNTQAIKILEAAVATHGKSVEARNQLAALYMPIGRQVDAERILREAVALEPRSFDSHLNLANCALSLGNFDTALGAIEKALVLVSDSVPALIARARIQHARGNTEAAHGDITRAAQSARPDAATSLELAAVELELGLVEAAFQHFEVTATSLDPQLRTAGNVGLAHLFLSRGQLDRARVTLEAARASGGTHPMLDTVQQAFEQAAEGAR